MWQVYPYGHTKLKLSKDLKTAEAHLRISLIDSEQIENMSKVSPLKCRFSMIVKTITKLIQVASMSQPTFSKR